MKSAFVKNVLSLFSGTLLTQCLPFVTAPILARIYMPSDYGYFGVFLSLTLIFASFSTLEYSSGIIVTKDDRSAKMLIRVSLFIAVAISMCLLIVFLLFKRPISSLLESSALENFLLLSPIAVVLHAFSTVTTQYALRNKLFTLIAKSRVLTAVTSSLVSIGLGLMYRQFWCLIAGYIAGQLVGVVYQQVVVARRFPNSISPWIKRRPFAVTLRRFSRFPKFSLPSGIINVGINQLPVFLLGGMGHASAVGYYNMNQRMLGLPISFISTSLGEVFRQQASEDYRTSGTCRPLFLKTLFLLTGISILPFAVLMLWGRDIFVFVLGENWEAVGEYTRALGILFLFRFIASPLSYVYVIAGRLKEDLYNHIYFLLSSALILYFLIPIGIITALFVFALNYSLVYAFVIYRSYKFSSADDI